MFAHKRRRLWAMGRIVFRIQPVLMHCCTGVKINADRFLPRYAPAGVQHSQLRRELHAGKEVQGVVITRVDPGSASDEVG
jgi:hypothetical protein